MPKGNRRPPRACTAATPSKTPSTPSYLPASGTVSRCEPIAKHGQLRSKPVVTTDQVAGGIEPNAQAGLLHPLGHSPVQPAHRLAQKGARDLVRIFRKQSDLLAAREHFGRQVDPGGGFVRFFNHRGVSLRKQRRDSSVYTPRGAGFAMLGCEPPRAQVSWHLQFLNFFVEIEVRAPLVSRPLPFWEFIRMTQLTPSAPTTHGAALAETSFLLVAITVNQVRITSRNAVKCDVVFNVRKVVLPPFPIRSRVLFVPSFHLGPLHGNASPVQRPCKADTGLGYA